MTNKEIEEQLSQLGYQAKQSLVAMRGMAERAVLLVSRLAAAFARTDLGLETRPVADGALKAPRDDRELDEER